MTGVFQGSLTLPGTNIVSTGAQEAFVSKFDVTGTLQWVYQVTNRPVYTLISLTVDHAANIYVVGSDFTSATRLFKLSTTGVPLQFGASSNSLSLSWSALAEGFALEQPTKPPQLFGPLCRPIWFL
jgi:hypothetical protein